MSGRVSSCQAIEILRDREIQRAPAVLRLRMLSRTTRLRKPGCATATDASRVAQPSGMVWHGMTWRGEVRHGMVWRGLAQLHGMDLYGRENERESACLHSSWTLLYVLAAMELGVRRRLWRSRSSRRMCASFSRAQPSPPRRHPRRYTEVSADPHIRAPCHPCTMPSLHHDMQVK